VTTRRLLTAFPGPPRGVRSALETLSQAEAVGLEPAGLHSLDRPWDPARCSTRLRAELWPWLDDVVGWLNHTYVWRTADVIPGCWPMHPHIAAELAVLACMRVAAGEALTPHALEEWHRYALPGFLTRLVDRLGPGCSPGRHTAWPASSWVTEYGSSPTCAVRQQVFASDTTDPRAADDRHDPERTTP
jgi:hypothetical protein